VISNPSLDNSPNVDEWVSVNTDGRITAYTGKVDIGQRISTALALVVAEELDVDYDRIDVERTLTGRDPNEGMTSGSNSMEQSANALRAAGATARHFMLAKAAEELGVDVSTLEVGDGLITSRETNGSTTYGDLMGGKAFGIEVNLEAELKHPADYTQVGTQVVPRGLEDIVTGKAQYVHDMNIPGMLHARVVRPPHYHASLKSIDEGRVARLEETGVTVIRDGSFIAVTHEDEYQAIKARDRMAAAINWDLADGLPSQDLYEALTSNARDSKLLIDGIPQEAPIPNLGEPPIEATATLSARFEKPYIMHGSIGPSAAMALSENRQLKIWCHSQGIYPLRASTAEVFEMDPEDVIIEHVLGSGCYGHNGADDVAFDAALIARAIPGKPILLKWTREDEHAWEPYGSAMVMELRGSLDSSGNIIDWSHDTYSDTHNMRPAPGPNKLGPGRLLATRYMESAIPPAPPQQSGGAHNGKHRNQDPLYTFPNRRIVKHMVEGLPLRVSALRALGAYGNVFALESFIDEMAEEAGVNPVEFRLRNLEDERAKAVVKAAADLLYAGPELKDGVGRGIAFAQYKNCKAYAAVGIELEVTEDAEIKLLRAVTAADAGHVVDPNGIVMQLEGGVLQAASWTLYEEVIYDAGGVTSRDWDTYPILRFDNVPEMESVVMDRPGDPFLGAGEGTSAPTVAAIANAIYNATGLRLRRLPFTADAIKQAALG
jgi:CO/xanthine dehydrogenase Mo-binding subunit